MDKMFHFEFLSTDWVLLFYFCCCCYAGWTLKTLCGLSYQNAKQEQCVISQGHCVAMRCCRQRLWENGGSVSHLYSLQMARVSRITQILGFFPLLLLLLSSPLELNLRCVANRNTRLHHSRILFIAQQSAQLTSHTLAITHWEQCKNGL